MKTLKILDVIEYTDVHDEKDNFSITTAQGFLANQIIDKAHFPITTLRYHHIMNKDKKEAHPDVSEYEKFLPSFMLEGELNCNQDPNTGDYVFDWTGHYVVKDKPLREYIETLETEKRTAVKDYLTLSDKLKKSKEEITQYKKHPIRFMFKEVFRRKNAI